MHETSQVNFALLYIFGYHFVPRYKGIQEKLRTSLYGFKPPHQYGDILLKPVRKLNTDLIVEEWAPVAWQHINFYGRYEFTKASEPINME